jgi:hypothetical protein
MNLFTQRFKAAKQAGALAGHVFRVVNADNRDMILWSETTGSGASGSGMTWRGDMKEFRATFGVVKEAT